MTFEERNQIFAKEALSVDDVKELLGVSRVEAARVIRAIKEKLDRLNIRGKVHVQDYIEYFGLPLERYCVPLGANEG